MTPFEELENNISKYLLLEDKGIIKLLCATVVANRIPQLDPTWLFVVSSSSGGKSELLLALAHAEGIVQKDDLTSKTFISGAKKTGVETSLLFRLPDKAIMVIKDLTVLLKKDSRETDEIFSQLRMIYDGTFDKSFGTGEDIKATPKMGLIAGVTSVIEDYQADDAAVGQRAIKYYMKQPQDSDINKITEDIIQGKQDRSMRELIGQSFKDYLDGGQWDRVEIPELPLEIRTDIAALSNMATKARSSIKRKTYSRDNPIERRNLREMPFRFAKQLANLARAMIIMNEGVLTGMDQRILYQIALDSIPSSRKEVMIAATQHSMVTIEGLSHAMKIPDESVEIYVDDLVALDIMIKQPSYGANKSMYSLREDFRELMSKFEGIPMTNKVLDDEIPELRAVTPAEVKEVEQQLSDLGI